MFVVFIITGTVHAAVSLWHKVPLMLMVIMTRRNYNITDKFPLNSVLPLLKHLTYFAMLMLLFIR